ncbi:MAG: inorganic phosphate transporter [Bacteroidetes bacterium]|nr:inorganic phosphate transporter [Bacteroidota bacterium]
METVFLIIVVILVALAVSDLIVGVGNDAVNFLNSAIGAKVASFKVILAVAALGVLVGATFSGGMMEVARKGIFHPQNFYFYDIMVIFVAVMITDVVLLDMFNTFGLPTSTTVSIVFELLGGAVAVAVIKISNEPGALDMGDYINSGKALSIISGILLSVVISFTIGAIVQWITRLIFSFNYEKSYKYFGSVFGGIAISAITYFMLIKGAKGATFMPDEAYDWIKDSTTLILGVSFVGWTILLQLLHWIVKLNILKFIVLAGTFALAMAFAGNDLVNFIGVPLAGLESYKAFIASPGADPHGFLMSALAEKIHTPTLFLLIAGLIMVLTLFLSKKAKSVVRTSLNLSRQSEGYERFGSTALSRSIVRVSLAVAKSFHVITPDTVSRFIDRQFDRKNTKQVKLKNKEGAPDFDLIRASVNLVVASILIAIATNNKLPLSTTYVTFMVAMGTSLADRAWGADSAVYRITGVLSVIGGWFFTAICAFTVCFVVAYIIHYGSIYAIGAFVLIAVFSILRTHVLHRKREKTRTDEEHASAESDELAYDGILQNCTAKVTAILSQVAEMYVKSVNGIAEEDRKQLQDAVREVVAVNSETKRLKANVHNIVKRLNEDSVPTGHYYVQVLDYLRETAHCLTYIAKPGFEHINNNHKPFVSSQKEDMETVKNRVVALLEAIIVVVANNEYTGVNDIITEQHQFLVDIEQIRKKQIKRIKADETGTRASMLFLNIMHETKNIILHSVNLLKAQRDFVEAEKLPRE